MTPEEYVESKANRKRETLRILIPLFCVTCLFFAVGSAAITGWREGSNLRSWDEFVRLLPGHLLFAVAISLLFVFLAPKLYLMGEQKTVVCSKCSIVKTADDNTTCSCGSKLIDIERMKWIEDK